MDCSKNLIIKKNREEQIIQLVQRQTNYDRETTIKKLAKLFTTNIKIVPSKLGERNKSAIVKKVGKTKIYPFPCKISLKSYINDFKKNLSI